VRLVFQRLTSARSLGKARSKSSTRKDKRRPLPRFGVVGRRQRGMLVGTRLVKTEQDHSIWVNDLPEVVVRGGRFRQAEHRLVPLATLEVR
jgi:hypothetical protein